MALKQPNGSCVGEERQRTHLPLGTYYPDSKQTNLKETMVNTRSPKQENWAINIFQSYKSLGVDGIFPIGMQEGPEEVYKAVWR